MPNGSAPAVISRTRRWRTSSAPGSPRSRCSSDARRSARERDLLREHGDRRGGAHARLGRPRRRADFGAVTHERRRASSLPRATERRGAAMARRAGKSGGPMGSASACRRLRRGRWWLPYGTANFIRRCSPANWRSIPTAAASQSPIPDPPDRGPTAANVAAGKGGRRTPAAITAPRSPARSPTVRRTSGYTMSSRCPLPRTQA